MYETGGRRVPVTIRVAVRCVDECYHVRFAGSVAQMRSVGSANRLSRYCFPKEIVCFTRCCDDLNLFPVESWAYFIILR